MKTPPTFPFVVCWDEVTRQAVTDPTALNVRDSVFLATHAPSPIRRLNVAMSPPVATTYSEQQLRTDFFQANIERLFCVVTGNPGTGKSHLIRWLAREADRANRPDWHVVVVPRHAANLADVIRRVLGKQFSSDVVGKIREQLERTSDLTADGAQTKVLDELAFVLEPQNRKNSRLEFPDDEEHQEILLPNLPALLRDPVFRRHVFAQGPTGIVSRLAQHLMGRRTDRPSEMKLEWKESDLRMAGQDIQRASAEARELASHIAQDSASRQRTAAVLNVALKQAGPGLLGLRRGQLGAALLEIRRQLHTEKKELVLLIEDLSVSQGMDAELIEALLIKPNEEGAGVCPLRSIVGVTNEDFATMRTNLLGRIDLAVNFDVPLSEDRDGSDGFSERDLLAFASRYLNATRFRLEDLDNWAAETPDEPLPSFCQLSKCPNRTECHAAFGAVDGRGLYPLSESAIVRLYRKHLQDEGAAFNPRKFVDGVLRFVLEKGATEIPSKVFASRRFLEWFRLDGVGVDGQMELTAHFGPEAERARTLVEIYAGDPAAARLETEIASVFGLKGFGGRKRAAAKSVLATTAPVPTPTPAPSAQDEFDRWLNGEPPSDRNISDWRALIKRALDGAHDWDTEPLRGAYGVFESAWIGFEGQRTVQRGDIRLVLPQRVETVFALKTLKYGAKTIDAVVRTGDEVAEWVAALRKELAKYNRTTGAKPLEVAVHLLGLAALVRGKALNKANVPEALQAIFAKVEEAPAGPAQSVRSPSWAKFESALVRQITSVQKFILNHAGAPKGLAIGADYIDTVLLLPIVTSAAGRVRWDFDEITETHWPARQLAPLRDAMESVRQWMPKALEEIKDEARQHLLTLDAACGDATPAQLSEVLRGALDRGREATAFSDPRLDEARPALDDFAAGRFAEAIKMARQLEQGQGLNHQILNSASIDLAALRRLTIALQVCRQALQGARTALRNRLEQLGTGDMPALEQGVRDGIQSLRADLEQLIQD